MSTWSLEWSIRRDEILLELGDRTGIGERAGQLVTRAEAPGLRPLAARTHYLRGRVLRRGGDAAAAQDCAEVVRLLDAIKGEEGSGRVLERADLAAMYGDCGPSKMSNK